MSGGDDWYPLALSNAIEPASSAGVRLFDNELVIWRDAGGTAHVWEDRCPHRGMKLSFGFVRGDHIACLYHGWQYNRSGQCHYIPAHPDLDVPNTIRVPVYPAQERSGMVWSNLSPTPLPFDLAADAVVPLRSLYLDCNADAAIAALGAVRLQPFASQALSDTVLNRVTANLYDVASGGDRLRIGIQPVSAKRTALHIAIVGLPQLYRGHGQRHFLEWALQLRRLIEQPRGTVSTVRHPVAGAA